MISRRLFTAAAGILGLGQATDARAAAGHTAWDFSFPGIEGGTVDFAALKGRVLLVVNTASYCGYTYQYEQLEALHKELEAQGLTVIGVPSGDFMQEKGSNIEVKQFCDKTFDVKFPMAAISRVRGSDQAPFYAWVRSEKDWQPRWNFYKVFIGRDGAIRGVFSSGDEPKGDKLRGAIMTALAEKTAA